MKKLYVMVMAALVIMTLGSCTSNQIQEEPMVEEIHEWEYEFYYEEDGLQDNEAAYSEFVHEFLFARIGYEVESAVVNVRIDGSKDGPIEWFIIEAEGFMYDVKYGAMECYAVFMRII